MVILRSQNICLIHGVCKGQLKNPKHILLPMAAKTITGNAQLIQILNRLGHGLSYSRCEEIDNIRCLSKMSNIPEKTVSLPDNIESLVFYHTSMVQYWQTWGNFFIPRKLDSHPTEEWALQLYQWQPHDVLLTYKKGALLSHQENVFP